MEKLTRTFRDKLLLAASFVVITAMAIVAFFSYRHWNMEREMADALADLKAAIAEVDQAEPDGWDLKALERRRPPAPDGPNGAEAAQRAWSLLPEDWAATTTLPDLQGQFLFSTLSENHSVPMTADDAKFVTAELDKVRPAVLEARKLIQFNRGRFQAPRRGPLQFLDAMPPHIANLHLLAKLLAHDALLEAHERKTESAWMSVLATVHVGRIAGGEPGYGELMRLGTPYRAAALLQHVLGQGEVSDAILARTMRLFEEEMAIPTEEHWLRQERAMLHEVYSLMAAGQLDLDLAKLDFKWPAGYETPDRRVPMIQRSHAYALRFVSKSIEYVQKGPSVWHSGISDLEDKHKNGLGRHTLPALAEVLTPAIWGVARVERHSKVNCLLAGLAAERYRLKNGRWPKKAEDLIAAGFLKAIPLDYAAKKPVRFRLAKDGVVFFCRDHAGYEGDAFDSVELNYPLPILPPEFRVWSPEFRHRSPPKPKQEATDK